MKALIAWLRAQNCPYADLRSILKDNACKDKGLSAGDASQLPAISKKTRAALSAYSIERQGKEVLRLCRENQTRLILWGTEEYPDCLYEVDEPPPVLYLKGRGTFPPNPGIAIVGTRHTTRYGIRATKRIAGNLAAAGIVVISGFAEGIDTAAHRAALETGETIAVLGSGMDWIYPKSNSELYKEVANSGVLVTEFPFGEKPYGYHFPFRNRLISGLSDGIVLIEGTHKSGAMSTVRHGLEQGKTIYALPGDIDRKKSEGPNQLIFEGAEPLLDERQIIDRYGEQSHQDSPEISSHLSQHEIMVLTILDQEPCGIERIRNLSNLSIHDIVSVLTSLEINDLIVRQGNNYYRSRR